LNIVITNNSTDLIEEDIKEDKNNTEE